MAARAEVPRVPARPRLPDEALLCAAVLVLVLLVAAWAGWLLGLPLSRWQVGLAAFAALACGWRRGCPTAGAAALAGALACVGLASLSIDPSYDGNAYHLVSAIALRDGWNPLAAPHVLAWMRETQAAPEAVLVHIADAGLWTDHYPKASWILAAQALSTFGALETAKWLQPFVALLAMLAMGLGLVDSGLPRRWAAPVALGLVVSPVAVAQLGTNYVDGLLGSALALQAGSTLSWVHARRGAALVVGATGLLLACSVKFTGAVYGPLLLLGGLALFAAQPDRPLRRPHPAWAVLLLAVPLCLWNPYGHNTAVHGHPFYPVVGHGVMQGQAGADFLDRGRIAKFVTAHTEPPGVTPGSVAPAWIVPRPWHYRTAALTHDLRTNAFGPWFIAALGIAVLSLAWTARRLRRAAGIASLTGLAAWALLSSLLNPELWWARYVPQLWWLPPLAAAAAVLAGQRALALLNLLPALAAATLTLGFWIGDLAGTQVPARQTLQALVAADRLVVSDARRNVPMLFSLNAQVARQGRTLRRQDGGACERRSLSFVETCAPPNPAAAGQPLN